MIASDRLAQQFEANRPHLRAVAYRILGSSSEADDALQEAWLKLQRAGSPEVRNAAGWLTTVVRSSGRREANRWSSSGEVIGKIEMIADRSELERLGARAEPAP